MAKMLGGYLILGQIEVKMSFVDLQDASVCSADC